MILLERDGIHLLPRAEQVLLSVLAVELHKLCLFFVCVWKPACFVCVATADPICETETIANEGTLILKEKVDILREMFKNILNPP